MTKRNGHGRKTAILYARVSTREQAEHGYSLAQQIEALREYAAREGFEIVEEVSDPGQSGASLERPGMDRVRDLVQGGGVSVMLAQDADRITRDPVHRAHLDEEMERAGTQLMALDDWGDNSHEGQLLRYMKGWVSKGERLKMTERSRRGRMQKAREGKVLANNAVDYGFAYTADRDGYEVDEETMPVVKRIFDIVAGGSSIYEVVETLNREGVEPPGKYNESGKWNRAFIRDNLILDDVYKPHTVSELAGMGVSANVLSRLDHGGYYGVWYANRRDVKTTTVVSSRRKDPYKKAQKVGKKPQDQWIAVPVPDAGIPIETVVAARAAIKNNKKASSAGRRDFWELSGGILECGECGRALNAITVDKAAKGNRKAQMYFYYACRSKYRDGGTGYSNTKGSRALELEERISGFVTDLLILLRQIDAKLSRAGKFVENGTGYYDF